VFSIFLGINEEEAKLEQGPLYFEAQSMGSAKIGKGVPNHNTGLVTEEQAR